MIGQPCPGQGMKWGSELSFLIEDLRSVGRATSRIRSRNWSNTIRKTTWVCKEEEEVAAVIFHRTSS